MTHLCIFCGSRVNSDEHVWPQWLRRLTETWPSEIRLMKATQLDKDGMPKTWEIDHPTIVSKVVCKTKCNGGWMSDLEKLTEPILTRLIDGRQTILTVDQQIIIARWMIKCAMVFDGMVKLDGVKTGTFYDKSDRFQFRDTLEPSAWTYIWLGHYAGPNLQLFTRSGTKSNRKSSLPFEHYIITMAFGRLVLQLLDFKFFDDQDREGVRIRPNGQWSLHTIELLSNGPRPLEWPPRLSFDDSHYTFDKFSDRFGRLI